MRYARKMNNTRETNDTMNCPYYKNEQCDMEGK